MVDIELAGRNTVAAPAALRESEVQLRQLQENERYLREQLAQTEAVRDQLEAPRRKLEEEERLMASVADIQRRIREAYKLKGWSL